MVQYISFYAGVFEQLSFYKTVYSSRALLPLEAGIGMATCRVRFADCVGVLFDSADAGLFRP